MTEEVTIGKIEKEFKKKDRMLYNIKGIPQGKLKGKPDFLTSDVNGRYVGIEAKSRTGKAKPNQIRRGLELITKNNGRYIVARADFDIEEMDNYQIPYVLYESEDMVFPKCTTELTTDKSKITKENQERVKERVKQS